MLENQTVNINLTKDLQERLPYVPRLQGVKESHQPVEAIRIASMKQKAAPDHKSVRRFAEHIFDMMIDSKLRRITSHNSD
jgi:hypothetical protein